MKQSMSIHSIDNILTCTLGAIICLVNYILDFKLPVGFESKLLEGAIMAGVGGVFGWIGKQICVVASRAFKTYFRTRKSKNNVGKN